MIEKLIFSFLWVTLLNAVRDSICLHYLLSYQAYAAIILLIMVTIISLYKNKYSSTLLVGLLTLGSLGLTDTLPIILGEMRYNYSFTFIIEFQLFPLILCLSLLIRRRKFITKQIKTLIIN